MNCANVSGSLSRSTFSRTRYHAGGALARGRHSPLKGGEDVVQGTSERLHVAVVDRAGVDLVSEFSEHGCPLTVARHGRIGSGLNLPFDDLDR